MSGSSLPRWVRVYALLAGACDTVTGVLLVTSPSVTLHLMGITALPAEPVYLRFVGAFVGAVGLTYLTPFVRGSGTGVEQRLRAVLELTAVVRVCVALFVAGAIARSALVTGWWSVSVADALLAAVQIAVLYRGSHELAG